MKSMAPLAILITAFMGNEPVLAQDWYTLTPETTDVTFSMIEQRTGGARIWLRFAQGVVGPDETRVLIDVTCAPPRALTAEARRYDATGSEIEARQINNEPVPESMVTPITRATCNYLPATSDVRDLDSTSTAARVVQLLRSENPSEQDRGIEIVLTEPGAFPPMVFVRLANALLARRRREEALEWFSFGHFRLTTDMRAAVMADPEYEQMAVLYPAYGFSASQALGAALEDLTEVERMALMDRTIARDVQIPRFYPLDMPAGGDGDVAWGSPDAPRPGSDFIIRRQLEAARNELSEGLR